MILDEIIEKTKQDLEIRKKEISLDLLGRTLSSNPYAPRDVKPFLISTKEEPNHTYKEPGEYEGNYKRRF